MLTRLAFCSGSQLRYLSPTKVIATQAYRGYFPISQSRNLSTGQYHELADNALESITESYENLIEKKPELDIDLSQGVLTLRMPPIGTYVINKQPPNMQIWLSSPISGPKRFDWDEKMNKWIYKRDESSLGALLKEETKSAIALDLDLDLD